MATHCEYCNPKTWEVTNISKNSAWDCTIDAEDGTLEIDYEDRSYGNYGSTILDIKFCPMCGRKLEPKQKAKNSDSS